MRGFACIGLQDPKNHQNVAAVLRGAGCYDASMVAIAGHRYHHHHIDTRKEFRHTPVLQVEHLHTVVPYECTVVAVECLDKATPLPRFTHPPRAFYVFGPEDGTLEEDILSWCTHKIYIPTRNCMNLAAAVQVVLYDRACKNWRNV